MREKIVKVVLRMCGLLAVAGLLTGYAMAGGGMEPDPNGPPPAAVVNAQQAQ